MPLHVYGNTTYPMAGKRDTTLKFDEDNVDPNHPVFVNMTQVIRVTALKKDDIEQMNHTIEDWLKNNELNITDMKSNVENAALRPLVKVLYDEFDDLFLEAEPSFIRAVLEFVIQRKLSYLRRAADSNKSFQKDPGPATPSALEEAIAKEPPLAPTSNPVPVAVNTIDFGIRARMLQNASVGQSNEPPPLSVATIRDVLPDPNLNHNNSITLPSFKLWADILRQDVNCTESHAIRYAFTDGILHIRQDRHFRAALLDAQRRSLSYAIFDITLLSPARE